MNRDEFLAAFLAFIVIGVPAYALFQYCIAPASVEKINAAVRKCPAVTQSIKASKSVITGFDLGGMLKNCEAKAELEQQKKVS